MAREDHNAGEGAVAAYKLLLRKLVDRRPSGTRQKIATAIGKHKSFVSQITNPDYAMPVPAKHLGTIFDLCHFSNEERRTFMQAYERAHPGRTPRRAGVPTGHTAVTIRVPVLEDPQRQADLAETIQKFADELGALAAKWQKAGSPAPSKHDPGRGSE